jgi:hypothetical protein
MIIFLLTHCGDNKKNSDDDAIKKVEISKDTIINGIEYTGVYIEKYNREGKIIQRGTFVNHQHVGKHQFFKNGLLYRERLFSSFSNNEKEIIINTEEIDTVGLGDDLSYLSRSIYYDNQMDTIFSKSYFNVISLEKDTLTLGDSLVADLKFYHADYTIPAVAVYFKIPKEEDVYTIMRGPGNICHYSYMPKDTGQFMLSGIAFVHNLKINEKDTTYFVSLTNFNKPYYVEAPLRVVSKK